MSDWLCPNNCGLQPGNSQVCLLLVCMFAYVVRMHQDPGDVLIEDATDAACALQCDAKCYTLIRIAYSLVLSLLPDAVLFIMVYVCIEMSKMWFVARNNP